VTTNSPRKACVFCNGKLKDPIGVKRIASNCDILIAANGGAKLMADLGLKPGVIIGDMDSAVPDMWNGENHIKRIPYSPRKDKSDAELAVDYALELGYQQVILVAATGGRLDHTLGNVTLLVSHPGQVALFDGTSTLVAVDKSEKCRLHGQIGTLVSLIPYSLGPFTIRTKGLKYQLQDESLNSATHGLSNELSQTETCVCVSNGVLLVYIQNHDMSDLSEDLSEVVQGK